jgi:hypothetical protein
MLFIQQHFAKPTMRIPLPLFLWTWQHIVLVDVVVRRSVIV